MNPALKALACLLLLPGLLRSAPVVASPGLLARSNLVAWCIVPFDARKRGPEERAAMLERLGFKLFAYDYRAEHIPTFDAEMEALKRHHVRLLAWWFPTTLNDEARRILDVLKRHDARDVQLWVTGGGAPTKTPEEQQARVTAEAARIRPIAEAAGAIGCRVGLYNHGAWFGEPENQIAIIEALRAGGVTNVGIVYNQHHGHDHIARFPDLLARMKPYLIALNLNGMVAGGDKTGRKIVPLAQGELDPNLLAIIRNSGWQGPIGILNHTDEDAEGRLQDNLDGLDWLIDQAEGRPARTRPQPRTWRDPGQPAPKAAPGARHDSAPGARAWTVESRAEREKLPLYQVIPAARPDELTPANNLPRRETYKSWHRSHGDNGGTRFSALAQINRQNVAKLQRAWTYHSRDGSNNIQCNPVIANGVMYAPTAGRHMVAVNAATGAEFWRFKPEGRPAFRGLVYWPGGSGAGDRILFCAGPYLYALSPVTGQPIAEFGQGGRTRLPGNGQGDFGAATAGPAVFENIIVVPGFEKDVWGFDIVSGRHLWTFHTVPHDGEFGRDTWEHTVSYGANCWSGMAMDEARGIAYITTGGPKPNFIGTGHLGQNLFANCVVAIDARSGRHLWHFQEIRHDLWDLDVSAPPNLGTITRDGRRVDVVAACTKMGNTLLLDRVTGKPIYPFRLRRAPTSTLLGERTWPYQPDVELPEPFLDMEFTEADLTDRNPEVAAWARGQFASATHGFFVPCSEGRANLFFGIDGGAEWTGACIDADTGRLYVSANHVGWAISAFRDADSPDDLKAPKTRGRMVYEQLCMQCHGPTRLGVGTCPPLRGLRLRADDERVRKQIREGKNSMPAQTNLGEADLNALLDYLMARDGFLKRGTANPDQPAYTVNGYPKFYDPEGFPASKPPWGTLNCIDLNTGRRVWRVPLGEYPQAAAHGLHNTGTENYGGAIVTAGGLVFCAGTRDNKIRAFDKDTGGELWSATLPWTGNAPPASYEVDGRQFIVIAATGGNKLGTPFGDAYVAFALPQ